MFLTPFLICLSPVVLGVAILNIIICLAGSKALRNLSLPYKLIFSLSVGWQLGVAANSFLYYLGLNLFGSPVLSLIPEAAALSCSLILNYLHRQKLLEFYKTSGNFNFYLFTITLGWLIVISGYCYNLLVQCLTSGYGAWDGWAIWNLRAITIFLSGTDWMTVFDSDRSWTHNDYPLLVPLTIARAWSILGNNSFLIPQITSWLFGINSLLLLCILIGRYSCLGGWIAGAVFLFNSHFVSQISSQYADLALSGYFISAGASLVIWQASPAYPFLLLTTVMAVAAAWTKNEGAVFMLLTLAAALFSYKKLKVSIKELLNDFSSRIYLLLPVAAIVIFGIFSIIHFKLFIAYENDLFDTTQNQYFQDPAPLSSKIIDASRYVKVLSAFWDYSSQNFNYAALLGVMLFIYNFTIVRKVRINLSPVLLFFSMTSIYFLIFLTTGKNLDWHLGTAFNRLALQLTPLGLFAMLSLVVKADDT